MQALLQSNIFVSTGKKNIIVTHIPFQTLYKILNVYKTCSELLIVKHVEAIVKDGQIASHIFRRDGVQYTRNISYWSQTRMEPAINALAIVSTNSQSYLEIYLILKLTCTIDGGNLISMSNYIFCHNSLFLKNTLLVQTNKTQACGGNSLNY